MYRMKVALFFTVFFSMSLSLAASKASCIDLFGSDGSAVLSQDSHFSVPLESLATPRKYLYHQVPKRFSNWLFNYADKKFRPIPESWIGLGDHRFIWTSEGKKFYSREGTSDYYDTFQIKIKSGWRFVELADLILPKNFRPTDSEANQIDNLAARWMIQNQKRHSPSKNEFSQQMIDYLEEQGYISHSAFYFENNIAGHHGLQRQHNKKVSVFVIIIPESAEFRIYD
jgi:hypothetical protein